MCLDAVHATTARTKLELPLNTGSLYLVPTPLSEASTGAALPADALAQVARLRVFAVENAKSARAHLKAFGHPGPMQSLAMIEIGTAEAAATEAAIGHLRRGEDVGLMSEAGNPAVADPGALLVRAAHENGNVS